MVRITLGCGLSVNAGTAWSVPAAIGPDGSARPASVETMQPITVITSAFSQVSSDLMVCGGTKPEWRGA